MPANIRSIMREPPRALVLSERDTANEKPLDYEPVSRQQQQTNTDAMISLMASGNMPIDQAGTNLIAQRIEQHLHDKRRAESRPDE